MTILEIILISILWIILGIFLSKKWSKVEKDINTISIVFSPIVLLGAIIRQVFIEDWK